MRKAWVQFAASGDPSVPGVTWPRYSDNRETMRLDEQVALVENPYGAQFPVLSSVLDGSWMSAGL